MTVTGLAIDPSERRIERVKFDGEDYRALRDTLRFEEGQHLEALTLTQPTPRGRRLVMFLDEEGLFRVPQTFFSIADHPDRIYAGRAVVIGCDREGGLMSVPNPDSLLRVLRQIVIWREVEFAGMHTSEGVVTQHPVFGAVYELRTTAQFRPKGRGDDEGK